MWQSLTVREPQWLRGAYTSPPRLVQGAEGKGVGSGAIECWRGTVDELCSAVDALVEAVAGDAGASFRASVTWASGRQDRPRTLRGLKDSMGQGTLADLMVLKVDVSSVERGMSGTLLARQKIPGLVVTVTGDDRPRILGMVEFVFQRMMIGYVDRMGGWRGLAWMLTAFTPILLVSLALSPGEGHAAARILITLLAAIAAFSMFRLSYSALLVSTPLELLERLHEPRGRRPRVLLTSFYRHRHTRRVLGVVGLLLIGAAGSKLAEFLPIP